MFKTRWVLLIFWMAMGFVHEGQALKCPRLTYAQAYDIFASANAENFTKEPTTFEKFIAFFTGSQPEDTGEKATFMVGNVQIEGQAYKMVSRDDLSLLKDGGERNVFGGGDEPSRDQTSFSDYSEDFKDHHCAYALAYGPGIPNPGIAMLRFELYIIKNEKVP